MQRGLRGWAVASWDRILASDPGLGRLRLAASATVAMGSALGVEYLLGRLTHAGAQGTLVAMLLGAVVAMMGSNALLGPEVWAKVRTAAGFPFAVGFGLAAGSLVGTHVDLMLALFVVVMFLAVFVRRFGLPFFFYGFMGWMGYFFSSFLHTTPGMVPHLLVAVVVSSLWVLLLAVTVLRTSRRRVLRSTLRAFRVRVRAVVRDGARLLAGSSTGSGRRQARARRRLGGRQAGLVEAALMAEAWSEDPRGLPEGWTGPALRRRLLDIQQTTDRLAWAAASLEGCTPALVAVGAEVLEHLEAGRDDAAREAADRLGRMSKAAEEEESPGWVPARHLAVAALTFLDLRAEAAQPPPVDDLDGEFEVTTPLMMGYLPGSPAVARDVRPRTFDWNPLRRVDMPSRQAFQVAISGTLAIVLGRMVSPTRYYWAVIAAFVAFAGTGTRSETFLKAVNRVVGTMLGLVAAILVAHLTAGHTDWVLATILACVFSGFYLFRISYAYMIFFITIMIGQLYTVLGTFTDQLLVLRLEETAVGAAAGIVVGVLVAPLSTRDTVRTARDELLTTLSELLFGAARWVENAEPRPDLDALARALDDRSRRLALVARPLTRPLLAGGGSRRMRHRLHLYAAVAAHGRALSVALRRHSPEHPTQVAQVCRALAQAGNDLADVRVGSRAPRARHPLTLGSETLFCEQVDALANDPALHALLHLQDTLAVLADHARPDVPEPARQMPSSMPV